MKKVVALMLLSGIFISPAQSQQNQSVQGSKQLNQTASNSNADSQSNNAGNSQSIIFSSPGESTSNIRYSGTQTVKNVPSVNAPPLISSNDTCMGSTSGSVNVPGFGGAFGSTYKDTNCIMLKNSRELWNMGMRGAALARMCMDPDNREALEITGFKCPQTEKAERESAMTLPRVKKEFSEITDPFIRRRMGLDSLADK